MDSQSIVLKARSDKSVVIKGGISQRLVIVTVTAPKSVDTHKRSPMNIGIVLDKSGSMSGEKLDYVKEAACHALNLLNQDDRISIILYDSNLQILASALPVTPANQRRLSEALQHVHTGSSTNLSTGWLKGCASVADGSFPNSVNRVLLLTDGLANEGIVDLEELASHAAELHKRGVATSTFGVGDDFNEHLLEAMANSGGGNFEYIAEPSQIPGLFARELDEMLQITMRSTELTIEVPGLITSETLGGWRIEEQPEKLKIFLGDLYSGQQREIRISLDISSTPESEVCPLAFTVLAHGQNGDVLESKASLTYQCVPAALEHQFPVDEEVTAHFALADAREYSCRAMRLHRDGHYQEALEELERGRLRLAFDPSELSETYFNDLERKLEKGLSPAQLKELHREAYLLKKNLNNRGNKR